MAIQVTVQWVDSNPTTGVNHLEIWRKLGEGGNYSRVQGASNISLGTEEFIDTNGGYGLEDGETYYYQVRAYNSLGQYSNIEGNIILVSASWDLENATLSADSYDFSAQTTDPGGLSYSLDGTILYLASYSTSQIFQYPLSTPYDLSSAGVSTNITIAETPHGIDFSEDGVYLFVANASNKTISRYTLGTPWDVTTAVKDAGDLVSTNSNFGVQIKSDGTRIFAISNTASVLEHFDLSTPYDLSSAGASRGKALTGLTAAATLGFAIKSDGTKVYAMNKTDGVVQFSMDPAWDAFGTSNDGITVPIAATDADFRSIYIPKDIGRYMILDGSTSETIHKWDI